jgi:hypothetical protein
MQAPGSHKRVDAVGRDASYVARLYIHMIHHLSLTGTYLQKQRCRKT